MSTQIELNQTELLRVSVIICRVGRSPDCLRKNVNAVHVKHHAWLMLVVECMAFMQEKPQPLGLSPA